MSVCKFVSVWKVGKCMNIETTILNVFCVFFRFPGKTLKGKKYKPLFPYFAKVCRVCVLCLSHKPVPICQMKPDQCPTLFICLFTHWHLCSRFLSRSLNLSLSYNLLLFLFGVFTTRPPFIWFSSSLCHFSVGRRERSRWWPTTTSRRRRVQEWSTRHLTLELWVFLFLNSFFPNEITRICTINVKTITQMSITVLKVNQSKLKIFNLQS